MTDYHITPSTDAALIAAWVGPNITLHISSDSDFDPITEPLAVAKLLEHAQQHESIVVQCSVTIRPERLDNDIPPLLLQAFGFALLHVARAVYDNTGTDVRQPILDVAWKRLITARGFLGEGPKAFALSRDPDATIPAFLRDKAEHSFPERTKFGQFLLRAAQSTAGEEGQTFGYDTAESALITYLYETAKNSWEHGRETITGKPIAGFRGITAERLTFNRRDEISQRRIPDFLRDYAARVWTKPGQKIYALSAFDVGPGIHHTLPPIKGETKTERFRRAFLPGESRKPPSTGTNRGFGLSTVIDELAAARDLRALLFVTAAEIMEYRDYSTTGEWTTITTNYPKNTGTAMTLFVPLTGESAQQTKFFQQ